jgi:threonine/homoserine efflux transporter RhtA
VKEWLKDLRQLDRQCHGILTWMLAVTGAIWGAALLGEVLRRLCGY